MQTSLKLLALVAATAAALALPVLASAATTTSKTTTAKTTTSTSTARTTTAPMGPTDPNCWKALIRDWYDGRIDMVYPVHCYRDALKHLPSDVRTYSDAYDVITRALADATRGQTTVDPDAPVQPPASQASTTTTNSTTTTAAPSSGGDDGTASGGPIGGVLNGGDQGADGVPIPLLILAGLAVLLVAAGGAGLIARHRQQRRGA